jgi:sporulation protein YlmC with PRC-barrel domain
VPLPEQLLLSDLLSRRVRCDRGLEHGVGQLGWMHPPVNRLLGWASRPSALSTRRCIWRLDQLRGLTEAEVLVQGEPAETDAATLERLPTLLGAVLLSGRGEPLGRLADAAVELDSGRIRHYLVARSDPRLPGGSRWRLSPERIVDQRPGEVSTALQGLADLPLAHASLRETLLRRSRRWRDQWDEESSRLRDQWQQASGRFEERLEGWLEEPPWEEPRRGPDDEPLDEDVWPDRPWPVARGRQRDSEAMEDRSRASEPWEPWLDEEVEESDPGSSRSSAGGGWERSRRGAGSRDDPEERGSQGWGDGSLDAAADRWSEAPDPDAAGPRRGRRGAAHEESDDPWV